MAKIVVVIPTYNERGNIETLLGQLFALRVEGLNVLVVDDNSPDGTGALVESLRAGNDRLSVLHRTVKEGLGPAYVAGFRAALAEGADIICEMDADLSHHPSYLPTMLSMLSKCDVVLGSRYVAGGGVSNWNWTRRLISRFGNAYARAVLTLPYRDLTGGYKCYRRAVLEQIGLDNLSSVGYNFQIETTYRAHRVGFRIREVPIVFVERAQGTSKFNAKIVLESFWKVLMLRTEKKRS